jgi:transposase
MMTLPPTVKIYVSTAPCDMRKSFDGLAGLVQSRLSQDPSSGHLYAFFNARGDMVKILFFDRTGYALFSKRLEAGVFRMPWQQPADATHFELDAAELALILEGIDLRGAKRLKRWRKPDEPVAQLVA